MDGRGADDVDGAQADVRDGLEERGAPQERVHDGRIEMRTVAVDDQLNRLLVGQRLSITPQRRLIFASRCSTARILLSTRPPSSWAGTARPWAAW